jgi:dihydropyrimidinase
MKLIDTIKKFKDEGAQKSYVDFGIHGALFDAASQIEESPKAFDLGVTSFKMFMTYAKLKWMTDDYHLTWAMDVIGQCGGLTMVHAESGLVTDYLEDRSLRKKEDQKVVFVKTRPDYLEAEAIYRAVTISDVMDCPLYIVHISTAKGAEVVAQKRSEGLLVYGETCPQYLSLTDVDLQHSAPWQRLAHHSGQTWIVLPLEGIAQGHIDVIGSDHAPKDKKLNDPFFEAPFGSPQAETMLTITYDEGVNTGRIHPSKLVQVLSENPAKIFGLYPKKGILEKGSDADLVLFDPSETVTIQSQNQHSGARYTVYEGGDVGKPVLTMQRGRSCRKWEMKGKPEKVSFLARSRQAV